MLPTNHTTYALSVIRSVSPARLSKAAEGIANNTYQIRITHQTEAEISAFVTNGDGERYGCTIAEHDAFCSCADAMYRRVTCKHAAALALHMIRSPKAPVEDGRPAEGQKPNLKLVRTRPAWVAAA